MTRQFFVPGQPQGKGRAKVTVRGKFAHAYTPEKTASYENLIKMCYQAENPGAALLNGEIYVVITAVFGIPKSASKVKRAKMLAGTINPIVKPDWDNIAKVMDALNGIAWVDDSHVTDGEVHKCYGEVPGLKVSMTYADQKEGRG